MLSFSISIWDKNQLNKDIVDKDNDIDIWD